MAKWVPSSVRQDLVTRSSIHSIAGINGGNGQEIMDGTIHQTERRNQAIYGWTNERRNTTTVPSYEAKHRVENAIPVFGEVSRESDWAAIAVVFIN